MIPLRDNIRSRTTSFVNYAMIAACTVVFLLQLGDSETGARIVERYGMIPVRVFHPDKQVFVAQLVVQRGQLVEAERPAAPPPISPWITLVTCVFLHGGWMHFLGNMWILYIFGDNVEDRIGHIAYILFYIGCGVAASLAHLLVNSNSTIPTIGASGAIAGVMGAYFLLYPKAMVVTLVPFLGLAQIITLPAPTFLGIWFLLQFFQGTMSITSTQTGGVAWWAHIGGFAAGFGVAAFLRAVGETSPPVEQTRSNTDRISMQRFRRGPD